MSALGDYVHLSKKNYLKYGTARTGGSYQSPEQSLKAQREMYQKRLSKLKPPSPAAIDELKARISNESTQQRAREMAENKTLFNQSLQNLTDRVFIRLAERAIDLVNNPEQKSGAYFNTKARDRTDSSIVNIKRAKQLRNNILNQIKRLDGKTETQISEKTIQTLNKNFKEFFQTLGIIANENQIVEYKELSSKNTQTALEELVNIVSLSELNKATLHGVYGEVLSNMVSDNLKTKFGEALEEEVFKKLETGEHRSEFSLSKDLIPARVQQSFQQKTGYNLYAAHKTQDKIDATITILGEDVNASVKAYSTKGSNVITAHLQDINLIYNLATTQEQFGNHWLNLHALSRGEKTEPNDFDEELVKHMQYEALSSGNLLKKRAQHADTFIAIDADQGKVFVKTVPQILQEHPDWFRFTPKVHSIKLSNKTKSTWKDRIADLLMQLHQKKVSVSFKVYFDK